MFSQEKEQESPGTQELRSHQRTSWDSDFPFHLGRPCRNLPDPPDFSTVLTLFQLRLPVVLLSAGGSSRFAVVQIDLLAGTRAAGLWFVVSCRHISSQNSRFAILDLFAHVHIVSTLFIHILVSL